MELKESRPKANHDRVAETALQKMKDRKYAVDARTPDFVIAVAFYGNQISDFNTEILTLK